MTFSPAGNEHLTLNERAYRVRAFTPSGPLASKAMRIVGGRAQVYQLIDIATDLLYALKVMLPAFRAPQLVRNHELLSQLGALPGFEACKQTYLTPQTHHDDLARYPDLVYSSLTPWIPGTAWTMVINGPGGDIDANTSWEIAYRVALSGQIEVRAQGDHQGRPYPFSDHLDNVRLPKHNLGSCSMTTGSSWARDA